MNLLLLAHRVPYPANKGEKIRTFNNLAYLIRKGHTVTVFTPLENNQDHIYAKQLRERLNVKVVTTRLNHRYLRMLGGLTSRQALSVTNFYHSKLQKKLETLIALEKPDTIMCTSSSMAKYLFHNSTAALIKKQNTHLVMDFMDLDSLKWNQYANRKPWPLSYVYKREAKLLSKLESSILKHFDASMFVSAEERNLLQCEPGLISKTRVVTNGVDRNTYYPLDTNTDKQTERRKLFGDASPVILFTGVMDYFPNEDAVIWFADVIWPGILKKYPKAKFVIAGMHPSRKVVDLENRSGIEVTGYLEEIRPYYQLADLLVAPFQVARGIQNKVMQAMACGLPVIASSAGATGLKFVNHEHLIVAQTPDEYFSSVDTLVNDKESYQRIRQGGLNLVTAHHSWEHENAKLEQILDGKNQSLPLTTDQFISQLSPA